MHIDFLEFVAVKFKLYLKFVRLFLPFVSAKNKNLYYYLKYSDYWLHLLLL